MISLNFDVSGWKGCGKPRTPSAAPGKKSRRNLSALFSVVWKNNRVWGVFEPEFQLCGVAAYAGQNDEEGIIWGVYVADSLRGTGATDRLMRALINDAGARLSRLTLTVMSDNYPAIRLYQRLGFQRISLTDLTTDDPRQTWYLDLK
ncbi:GNAT family N-acetyltransferase [Dickeya dadantii]|uniref:GNAT family N-acetyltransferase n=1 Tax=Dickeya dadantii TaxID=204038 RepID=UPI0020A67F21|nr:GNAT family N-acetyltransferase [Dickeya dadantii]